MFGFIGSAFSAGAKTVAVVVGGTTAAVIVVETLPAMIEGVHAAAKFVGISSEQVEARAQKRTQRKGKRAHLKAVG